MRTKGCQMLCLGTIILEVMNRKRVFNISSQYSLIPSGEFYYITVLLVLTLLVHILADVVKT